MNIKAQQTSEIKYETDTEIYLHFFAGTRARIRSDELGSIEYIAQQAGRTIGVAKI